MTNAIGVAVLGLGNVGSQVVRIIEECSSDLTARIGAHEKDAWMLSTMMENNPQQKKAA